jgi:hypothetical protein
MQNKTAKNSKKQRVRIQDIRPKKDVKGAEGHECLVFYLGGVRNTGANVRNGTK